MQIFVIFYDAAGTKLGAGEIQSAYDFEHTRRLSRAGRFTFKVPLNDPRLLDVAADAMRPAPHTGGDRDAYVVGVARMGAGLVTLIDLAEILRERTTLDNAEQP